MSLAVSRGIVDGVVSDTMIAVAKASGVHRSAGSPTARRPNRPAGPVVERAA